MSENVRLVIWDLDETFWKGTLSEGGLQEYIQSHHDIVVELSHRGIINSICSKNDENSTFELLQQMGISEYFVFPSISWEPKGPRLKQLAEDIQLRPETIMFIDDNHGNRAEAAAFVPGIQVESETFIAGMLTDPRFQGRDDRALTRLGQYKLLETRKRDEKASTAPNGDNQEFLRSCDVRVYVEYDVKSNIDRAIELINRTNQLNFTKHRLPEDLDEARRELLPDLEDHFKQCGLIRVVDRYGDYGFVGFYALQHHDIDKDTGRLRQSLKHYCFSCRTLGMLVEKWLYDTLQQPHISVVGEVLTDLFSDQPVTWVRQVASLDEETRMGGKLAPEIRVHGGCEATAISHYLNGWTDKLVVTGNFHAANALFRVNSAPMLMSASDRSTPEFQRECALLDVPFGALTSTFFQAPEGTAYVFGGQLDHSGNQRMVHKEHGWELIVEPHGLAGSDFFNLSDQDLASLVKSLKFDEDAAARVLRTALHLKENYVLTDFDQRHEFSTVMAEFVRRLPDGSRLILLADHNRVRVDGDTVIDAPWSSDYEARCRVVASKFPHVAVASFAACVMSDEEVHVGGNHYDRMVYFRMAKLIGELLQDLPAKSAASVRAGVVELI